MKPLKPLRIKTSANRVGSGVLLGGGPSTFTKVPRLNLKRNMATRSTATVGTISKSKRCPENWSGLTRLGIVAAMQADGLNGLGQSLCNIGIYAKAA